MKPALLEEEWERLEGTPFCLEHTKTKHGLAARCLHDQPFGFTRDMLYRLRVLIENIESLPTSFTDEDDAIWLTEIADLISALLPPEKT